MDKLYFDKPVLRAKPVDVEEEGKVEIPPYGAIEEAGQASEEEGEAEDALSNLMKLTGSQLGEFAPQREPTTRSVSAEPRVVGIFTGVPRLGKESLFVPKMRTIETMVPETTETMRAPIVMPLKQTGSIKSRPKTEAAMNTLPQQAVVVSLPKESSVKGKPERPVIRPLTVVTLPELGDIKKDIDSAPRSTEEERGLRRRNLVIPGTTDMSQMLGYSRAIFTELMNIDRQNFVITGGSLPADVLEVLDNAVGYVELGSGKKVSLRAVLAMSPDKRKNVRSTYATIASSLGLPDMPQQFAASEAFTNHQHAYSSAQLNEFIDIINSDEGPIGKAVAAVGGMKIAQSVIDRLGLNFMWKRGVQVDSEKFFPFKVPDLSNKIEEFKGMDDCESSFPEFIPRYSATPYDAGVIKVGALVVSYLKEAGMQSNLLRDLYQTATDNYYGNGTPEGQMGRWVAVNCIPLSVVKEYMHFNPKSRTDGAHPTNEFRLTANYVEASMQLRGPTYFKLMSGVFPVRWHVDYSLLYDDFQRSVLAAEEELATLGEESSLLNVDNRATAGLAFKGKRRGETIRTEIAVADELLVDCAAAFASRSNPLRLFKKWAWGCVCALKPKAQAYTREEYTTKTRGIFPMNTCLQMPKNILDAAVYKADPFPSSPCLVGYNLMRGGFSNILLEGEKYMKGMPSALDRCEVYSGVSALIYSDNMYVFSRLDNAFFSVDGSKMEASVTMDIMAAEAERVLVAAGAARYDSSSGNFVLSVDSNSRISGGWAYYVRFLHHFFVSRSTAVFGTNQVRVTGQSSGNSSTFAYNTALMSKLFVLLKMVNNATPVLSAAAKRRMGGQECSLEDMGMEAFSDNWRNACIGGGLSLKIELAVPSFHQLLAAREDVIVPFDILGFDCFVKHVAGVRYLFPVLAKERILKAMVFNKSAMTMALKDQQATVSVRHFLAYAKDQSLFLMGGWARPDIAMTLMVHIAASVKSLSDSLGVDVQQSMLSEALNGMFASLTDDDAKEASRYLSEGVMRSIQNGSLLPTMAQMAKVTLDEETAINWMQGTMTQFLDGSIELAQAPKFFDLATFATVVIGMADRDKPGWRAGRVAELSEVLGASSIDKLIEGANEINFNLVRRIGGEVTTLLVEPQTKGNVTVPPVGRRPGAEPEAAQATPVELRRKMFDEAVAGRAPPKGKNAGSMVLGELETLLRADPKLKLWAHVTPFDIERYRKWLEKASSKTSSKHPESAEKLAKLGALVTKKAFDVNRRVGCTVTLPLGMFEEKQKEALSNYLGYSKDFIKTVWETLKGIVETHFHLAYQPKYTAANAEIIGEGTPHVLASTSNDPTIRSLYNRLSMNPVVKRTLHMPDYDSVFLLARQMYFSVPSAAQDIAALLIARAREVGEEEVKLVLDVGKDSNGVATLLRRAISVLENATDDAELGLLPGRKNFLLRVIRTEFRANLALEVGSHLRTLLSRVPSPGVIEAILDAYIQKLGGRSENVTLAELKRALQSDENIFWFVLATHPPAQEVKNDDALLNQYVVMWGAVYLAGVPTSLRSYTLFVINNMNIIVREEDAERMVKSTFERRFLLLLNTTALPEPVLVAQRTLVVGSLAELRESFLRITGVKPSIVDFAKGLEDNDAKQHAIVAASTAVNAFLVLKMKIMQIVKEMPRVDKVEAAWAVLCAARYEFEAGLLTAKFASAGGEAAA